LAGLQPGRHGRTGPAKGVASRTGDCCRNELDCSRALDAGPELVEDAAAFVRFNFDVLADNPGLKRRFGDEQINPVAQNGVRTQGTTHDSFGTTNSHTRIAAERDPH
jgi:hypothetical protein